ncbi:Phosphatidylinositol 3,5-bisphosphate-binding protein [Tilletia horrida]|uniref:Phosphatidylinositol 3,5-bisphosphate-binding protein n=1 Tax=Tilletia horrida TaxID=155126 RepID=A0AAN6GUT0_9BASI|nr:Phosphatidylinositol 3,5-bisphosphate-binding protein [Tilletia horrida]KAK0567347.1 Phosphatidylinositol 3,5-bisphosphate-binding protein [Tilletia horrida]
MYLARHHALTSHPPAPAFLHAAFFHHDNHADPAAAAATDIITCATPSGFFVAQTSPFSLLSRRAFTPSQGVLSLVVPIEHSSLLLLVGGGRVPRFAPNKLVLWDEAAVIKTTQKHQQPASSDKTEKEPASNPRPSFSSESQSSHLADADSIRDIDDDDDDNGNDNASSASSFSHDQHSESSSADNIDPSMYLSAVYHSTAASKPTLEINDPPLPAKHDLKGKGKANAGPAPIQPRAPIKSSPSTPRPSLGAAVAELEFAEAVTGVQIYPFDLPAPPTTAAALAKSYIIVVVLKTKAAVFELGPAQMLQEHQSQTAPPSSQSADTHDQGLRIIHRTTVDIAGAARQGLAAIAPASSHKVNSKWSRSKGSTAALIALPGRQKGHVQLVRVPLLSCAPRSSPNHNEADPNQPLNIGASTIIIAHSSALNSITLSPCGRLLITSSDRGTLVRLWSVRGDPIQFGSVSELQSTRSASTSAPTINPTLIRELRRGSDQAYILSVAIAPDLSALAVASDKGTIHIFRLGLVPGADSVPKKEADDSDPAAAVKNPKSSSSSSSFPIPKALKKATSLTRKHLLPTATSSLSVLPGSNQLKKYLASEWSTAHFRIPLRTFGGRSAEAAWGERGGPGGVETPHVRVPLKKAPQAGSASATSTARSDADAFGVAEDEPGSTASSEAKRRVQQPVEAMSGGSARSTEGGWAAMRARIEDVRRGEAGLDEKIFLTWTRSRAEGESARESEVRPPAAADGRSRYELIALTTGGGWYRLGLPDPHRKPEPMLQDIGNGATTHLQAPARPQRAGSSISDQRAGRGELDSAIGANQQALEDRELEKSGMISGCTLLEYRRFGQRDEWEQ